MTVDGTTVEDLQSLPAPPIPWVTGEADSAKLFPARDQAEGMTGQRIPAPTAVTRWPRVFPGL
jgi:hypothetical protein